MRTYAGHSDARRSNELYRRNLAKGQTGLSVAFDLPTQTGYDPDHVLSRGEVGKVGVSIAHKGDMHALLDGIPLDEMNTSMTINATAAWLLGLYVTVADENGVDRARAQGHDPERHHQGVPLARHLRLPARPLDAADRRHGRLQRQRDPELEPDQRLQLSPAGGRGDSGAGDRLRDVDRDRRPRRGQGARPGRRSGLPEGVRPDLVLRQRGRPLRRGAREAARDVRALGGDRARALRRHRTEAAADALRRPGQQPRADRGTAGEQRAADRAGSTGGHAGAQRARAGDPAAGLERGAGPAAAVGSAVEPADPAGARLRDRPARVPRHLRGLEGDGWAGRRAGRRGRGGDVGGRRTGRRGRGRRLHEGAPGRVAPRADRADRARADPGRSARTASPRPRTRR